MLKILEKGRILVVADESKAQKTVIRALENDGYDVDAATTEDQALFQLYDESPDLIAIDLKMRSSEGIRTFEKVMRHDLWKSIPVIVLTEDPEIIKYLDDFDLSLVESVSEPIKPLILSHRVDALLNRRKMADELNKCTTKAKSQDQIIVEAENTIKSQQKAIEKLDSEISNIVVKDSKTGLNNRKASLVRYEEEVARFDRNGLIFSLLLCDLDNLTDINSKYGRDAGDIVIKKTADLLTVGKRQQDYASHWGGGEFLVILPDTDLEGAIIFADRAKERIANHVFRVNDGTFRISMTFGVLCYDRTMPSDLAMQMADRALKKGKTIGRNKVVPADLL